MLPSARHEQDYPCNLVNKFNINFVFFFLIWWWVRVWHSLVRDTVTLIIVGPIKSSWWRWYCAQQVILFNFYLGEAIWTWWAVKLLPGARMRGRLDQTGDGHPKSRTRGCQVGHLRFSCLLCLSPWDLVCVVGSWFLSFRSFHSITLLLLSHCLWAEFHHVLFYLIGQQTIWTHQWGLWARCSNWTCKKGTVNVVGRLWQTLLGLW